MLALQNINLTLGKSTKLERLILQNLNLIIQTGEFVVIIGSNGTGKSTMFNIISGSITPDSGNILLDNNDITKMHQHQRSSMISKVMQDPKAGTMPNMTIFENMAFTYMRGKYRGFIPYNTDQRRQLFKEKLSFLNMNLENRLDELVGNLSGGERQALSLIMAIIADSKVLLLDEITAALDPKTAENVMKIATKIIKEEKRTTIMITHNMSHAIHYGDRTLQLADGKIIKEFNTEAKLALDPIALAAEQAGF